MSVISSPALDLAAPILPGEGAAGLRVGARISDLPADLLPRFTVHRRVNSCVPNAVITTYRADGVILYVENRIIDQITVSGAYQGTLSGPHGSISIGATVAEVEERVGQLVEDDTIGFAVASLPGLGFTVRDGHITSISVYRL